MAMKENSLKIFNYLRENVGQDVTAADIAEALDIPKRSVDGSVTSALCRKGLAERVPAQREVVDAEGKTSYQDVKFIVLTAEGLAFDPTADAE